MDQSAAAADKTAHGPRLHPVLRQRVASSQLLDLLPVGVYCCDTAGVVVQFNRHAAELWGRKPAPGEGEARFCGAARLFLPDGTPVRHAETPMAEVLRTGVPARDRTLVMERPDGSRLTVLVNIDPVFDDEGALVGAVTCFQDISELRRAQDALEAKERHLHALLEALPAAVYTTDAAGRITFYNEAAVELAGRRPELGSDAWCVSWRLYRPDGSPMRHDQCPMALALAEEQPIRGMEAIAERPDGSRVPFIPYPSPLFDQSGALVGAVNMLVDISERKRAEESQQLLISELNHRVKNTLAIVQAIANQTLRRARSPAEFASSFSGRVQALSRAHALLTQTTWSGAEIGALVRDQLLLGAADDQRIACSGPALMLEPQAALHMALVLHELGANARKYGALSVADGRLSVSWELHSGEERVLFLLWQETGGPAVSAPSVRGFGSVLIEQSLRSHGGEVSVHYAANGIVCQIRLPLPEQARHRPAALDAAGPARARAAAGAHPPGQAELAGRRILVIEDEPLVTIDVVARLQQAGCTVVGPAGTVAQAKQLIAGADFDAALLDANLAGDPVDELAAALMRRGVPFSFVTGYGRAGLPMAFRDAPLLAKPFTAQQLLATVRALRPRGAQQGAQITALPRAPRSVGASWGRSEPT